MAHNFKVGDIVRIIDRRYNGHENTNPPDETTILGIVPGSLDAFVFLAQKHGGYSRRVDGIEYPETWNVPIEQLDLIRSRPNKPVLAYTSACKVCKEPARKINKTTLCSNAKCKSRHSFKKAFPVPYKPRTPKDTDAEGFVICHECKDRIHWHVNDGGGSWIVRCSNSHIRTHEYEARQKIEYMGQISTYNTYAASPITRYIRKEDGWVALINDQS